MKRDAVEEVKDRVDGAEAAGSHLAPPLLVLPATTQDASASMPAVSEAAGAMLA